MTSAQHSLEHYQSPECKKDEFRRYLEKSGAIESLTTALVGLYEESDRPVESTEYIRKILGGGVDCGNNSTNGSTPPPSENENLKRGNKELKVKVHELNKTINDLHKTVETLKVNLKHAREEAKQAREELRKMRSLSKGTSMHT